MAWKWRAALLIAATSLCVHADQEEVEACYLKAAHAMAPDQGWTITERGIAGVFNLGNRSKKTTTVLPFPKPRWPDFFASTEPEAARAQIQKGQLASLPAWAVTVSCRLASEAPMQRTCVGQPGAPGTPRYWVSTMALGSEGAALVYSEGEGSESQRSEALEATRRLASACLSSQ